jgi:hypothetical protein
MLSAQDIAGDWQGILKDGKSEERVVVTIAKDGRGDHHGGGTGRLTRSVS